jgi:hypothetical protein
MYVMAREILKQAYHITINCIGRKCVSLNEYIYICRSLESYEEYVFVIVKTFHYLCTMFESMKRISECLSIDYFVKLDI